MNIKEFLLESGVYPNLLGFNYLERAVELAKQKGKIQVYNGIYEQIVVENNSTKLRVERAIRTVIEHIKLEDFKKIGINKRLTNGQFIYFFARR